MSTEHQRYSLLNQAAAIAEYAALRGVEIVKTYEDSGRSGIRIKGRDGLTQLIADVRSGNAGYSTILVFDVSRWGRFQDADESAHYEFICKEAGITVQYCAEQFENDGSLSAAIIKNIKRAMAGEYSRELSAKVFAGQCRLIKLGYRQGGRAGFGLRRLLLDEKGHPKAVLNHGEYKGLLTDRVILTPGPKQEIAIVHDIYKMFVKQHRSETEIANNLNKRGITNSVGRPWASRTVREILTNEKYIGTNVSNKTTCQLKRGYKRTAPDTWLRVPNAFQPIVDKKLFEEAQSIIHGRVRYRPNDNLLDRLREFLKEKGRLTDGMIEADDRMPSSRTYAYRFGGLYRAYQLIGYKPPGDYRWKDTQRTQREFVAMLVPKIKRGIELAGGTASEYGRGGLRINDEIVARVQVIAFRPARKSKIPEWWLEPEKDPAVRFAIVARLNEAKNQLLDFYLLPRSEIGPANVCLTPPTDSRLAGFRFENLDGVVGYFGRLPFEPGDKKAWVKKMPIFPPLIISFPSRKHVSSPAHSAVDTINAAYERQVRKMVSFVRIAESVATKLDTIGRAFQELQTDDTFAAVLRDESIRSVPVPLWRYVQKRD